jgi:hypothetical protein
VTLSKQQLKDFILSEVKKIITADENLNLPDNKIIQEATADLNIENLNEEFETVLPATEEKNESEIIGDVKKLSEEFKRMKQLVDFRSPLLMKD